jgi:hypothetical protein
MQDIWLGALGRLSGEVSFLVNPYIQYRRHGANSTPLRSEYRWTSLIKWRFGLLQALLTRTVSRKWRQAT